MNKSFLSYNNLLYYHLIFKVENYTSMRKLFILLIVGLCFNPLFINAQNITPEQYIETYKLIAIREMHAYKIPASITLAQGILESGSGNSKLAREANNHFGIKCHKDWKGDKFFHDDDAKDECFRVYDNAEESYKDHSLFLAKKKRYAFLFDYKVTNYKKWAKGLKKAGYATNPKYPSLLINLIERYDLHQYDKVSEKEYKKMLKKSGKKDWNQHTKVTDKQEQSEQVTIKTRPKNKWKLDSVADPDNMEIPSAGRSVLMFHNIKYVSFQEGDNLEKISKETGVSIQHLYRYNDINQDTKFIKGDRIYLQPKRRSGAGSIHVVKGNETLWEISQHYGIKYKILCKRNHITPGTKKVKAGTKLWIKGKKPLNVIEEERQQGLKIEKGEVKAD